jgi:hypothetical protein
VPNKARVFVSGKLFQPSFMDPLGSYKENEVL